ncbi:MAG: hypothetical protein ACK4FJ_06185 [Ferrovibrio sp.]|uniref:hypothetical protein n=1 Tax=Ferrovibrio sp. TaxID=1917215 RepID=UPI00391BA16A
MKFDVAAFLSSTPVRIEPLSAADLVSALERSSRPLSRGILVNLVQTEHLPFHVAEAIRRMSRCEVWKWRHVNGFDRRYKTRCNHPLCPACTGRLARQEAERVWKLFNAAAGAPILFDDLTWLTVNIGYLPIGSSFKAMAAQAKKAIRNMRNRKFPGTVWAMELEIQLQDDGQGKLHAHGLVWHPGVTRESIEEALRALFTEARAVCAKELRSRRIRREAKGVTTYKADISLKVKGWGECTAAILVGLIASYESMRSRGRFGLRFEMGLRRKKVNVEMSTIQVDSVEELLITSMELSVLPENYHHLPVERVVQLGVEQIEAHGIFWIGNVSAKANAVWKGLEEAMPDRRLTMIGPAPDWQHVIIDIEIYHSPGPMLHALAHERARLDENGVPWHMLPMVPDQV